MHPAAGVRGLALRAFRHRKILMHGADPTRAVVPCLARNKPLANGDLASGGDFVGEGVGGPGAALRERAKGGRIAGKHVVTVGPE